MRRNMRYLVYALVVGLLVALTATSAFAAKQELIVFHAGSLSTPMAAIEEAYEKANPDVDIFREAGGSAALARKIIDLDGKCDAYFSADYLVIERLLRPDFADWNIMFSSNELVLMYGPKSKYADEIDESNWYKILLRPDVRWGHSDKDADPCGYRSLMVLQLAEKYYDDAEGLYEKALDHPGRAVRPKAVHLVAMVQSGALDYAFEYRSVAVQHGFEFVKFPDEINLKNPDFAEIYETAEVERAGKEPGETIITKGCPIVYGLTIPKGAPHEEGAVEFLEYFLDPEGGLAILEEMGQATVGPRPMKEDDPIPEELKPLMGAE
jgi:molybdate/tungstate transport system substrate-binding protein